MQMVGSDIKFVGFENGVVVVNTTPHPLTMQDIDGTIKEVPTSVVLNAEVKEKRVDELLVKSVFVGTEEGEKIISFIKKIFDKNPIINDKKLIIAGSIIAAQAYPGKVFGITPVPGYERVAPEEKRMRCDKFTTF